MTTPDIRAIILQELGRIAPEVDLTAVDPSRDLRDECDIDSMDFLNLITALHQRLGADIPELDYPKLMALDSAVDYLTKKVVQA